MERGVLASVLILIVAAFAAASVFAYYPFQLTVSPVSPPVTFESGSNANQDDLGSTGSSSNRIEVSISPSNTSVTVKIHPTYNTTYYKNVTLLRNSDSKAYNVYLIISEKQENLPSGSEVYLIVYSSNATRNLIKYPNPEPANNTYVNKIELVNTNTNTPTFIGTLGVGAVWEFDFLVRIPEGSSIEGASATFKMHIVYTPSAETPP
ncbi:MAG: hypothetical protein QE164_02295 [Candidatus Nezhaarchaeota archaeon]|nr:hypothetical protein [Candidatus Nezhaarchaeota archaeon]